MNWREHPGSIVRISGAPSTYRSYQSLDLVIRVGTLPHAQRVRPNLLQDSAHYRVQTTRISQEIG